MGEISVNLSRLAFVYLFVMMFFSLNKKSKAEKETEETDVNSLLHCEVSKERSVDMKL